ncbi:hypothetical protein ACWDYH_05965 [Nocardia goodfellowii]
MTVIVVMGVAGSGKSTVGLLLAEWLGVEYQLADLECLGPDEFGLQVDAALPPEEIAEPAAHAFGEFRAASSRMAGRGAEG